MEEKKTKYDRTARKLQLMVKNKKSHKLIKETLNQLNTEWDNLDGVMNTYLTAIKRESKANGDNNAEELEIEFAETEQKKDELVELVTNQILNNPDEVIENAAEVGIKASQQATTKSKTEVEAAMEVEEEGTNNHDVKSKGLIQRGYEKGVEVYENVANRIGTLLSGVKVSRKEKEIFEKKLEDQLVEKWSEEAQTKVFKGVEMDKYEEFLELFQITTGIDEKTMAAFKALKFADLMNDQMKTFTCEATDMGGKYGMYASVKRPNENKIDVAIALYNFQAEFVGSSTAKHNHYNIWHSEKDEKTGLYRLTKPVVEDVLTGRMIRPDQRLRMEDINALTQNFIIAKALTAFAHSGTIPRVCYEEDGVAGALTDQTH